MNEKNADPEDDMTRLAQEATNQSTPDKALQEQGKTPSRRKVATKRAKPPDS